jgi:myosin protein heavy chain
MESTEISAAKPKNGASASSARSLVEIRNDRESRTTEAMKMKDEQIRILTEQNNKLLDAIERGEEEISAIQLEKLHLEEENREVREQNFSVQSKRRFADDEFEKLKTSADEAEKELKVKKSQNTELLGALETEETTNAKMASEYESCKEELRELKIKCSSLERSSKSHEETSTRYSNEANVKSEEIRLLRSELDSLKHQFNEASMKYSVEVESLQEQLRVKKEKQYQLLMQLQGQEEARRKAEEKFVSAEDRLNFFHKKSSAAETQLQLDMSEKVTQSDMNQKLLQQNQELRARKNDLVTKLQKDEQDVLRLEAETRDNGDQLREMAEKLFQLLERLKLAEMGKTRSIEALRAKEEEVHDLKKRNTVLTKDNTKGGKVRLQAELDKKVIEDQLKELKKHNVRLGQRCKEEAKLKVRAVDQVKDLEQKVKKLDGRLSFLVNTIQRTRRRKLPERKN